MRRHRRTFPMLMRHLLPTITSTIIMLRTRVRHSTITNRRATILLHHHHLRHTHTTHPRGRTVPRNQVLQWHRLILSTIIPIRQHRPDNPVCLTLSGEVWATPLAELLGPVHQQRQQVDTIIRRIQVNRVLVSGKKHPKSA
uniref:Putative secreted protein n=1 Tax=Anopheles darlingi TaxID=43151 RepID=A0A2M4D8W5_ANODA